MPPGFLAHLLELDVRETAGVQLQLKEALLNTSPNANTGKGLLEHQTSFQIAICLFQLI